MSKLMKLVDDLCNACHYRAVGLVAHGRDEAWAAVGAAVAELERDAARYRWLRGEVDGTALPLAQVVWKLNGNRESHNWTNMADGWSLDEHIDTAMEAEK